MNKSLSWCSPMYELLRPKIEIHTLSFSAILVAPVGVKRMLTAQDLSQQPKRKQKKVEEEQGEWRVNQVA